MTKTEQERAEFEAWAGIEYRNADEYTKRDYDMGFAAWQAARRAPVVPQGWSLREVAQDALDWLEEDDLNLTHNIRERLLFALAAAPQPPEAATVQMPNVDTIGVMLELESRIPFVESQTTRRAMDAAVQLLRILAAHGVK